MTRIERGGQIIRMQKSLEFGNVKVSTVVDSRFNVTKRSPQIQKSSKCGSIEEPRSGLKKLNH